MKTITLTSHQAKMIRIILKRGIDYYPGNTSEEEKDLFKQVKKQLRSKTK